MTTKYEALKNRIASWKEKGAEQAGHAFQAVEVGATAFGFGFLRGKMGDANGDLDVVGVPASLGTSIVLHGLGFMGVFGKHSEHVHNVADGALAEYAAVQGMRMGAQSSANPGTKRIAGHRVAGLPGMNPFQQRASAGFSRGGVANPFVRVAA